MTSGADTTFAKVSEPKIYVSYVLAPNWGPTEVLAFALAEDGTGLGSHLCSNPTFIRHDMGFTSSRHRDAYDKHYPDGYDLEFIEPAFLDTHEGFQKAFKLNQEMVEHDPKKSH